MPKNGIDNMVNLSSLLGENIITSITSSHVTEVESIMLVK